MFEYFLRVEVRESTDMAGESDEKLRFALSRIETWMDGNELMSPLGSDRLTRGEIVHPNGIPLVVAFGARNHAVDKLDQLRELVRLIADVAPGSYGFLYHLDSDLDDRWRVTVLRRGQVTEEDDTWFSSIIPMVEDPARFDDD